jgi:hypothetical protein
MIKKIMMMIAVCGLTVGNLQASSGLSADLTRETAAQEVINQEINLAMAAFSDHSPNWPALTRKAVRDQRTLLVKERILLARARREGYATAEAEATLNTLEANMNELIRTCASIGVNVN